MNTELTTVKISKQTVKELHQRRGYFEYHTGKKHTVELTIIELMKLFDEKYGKPPKSTL